TLPNNVENLTLTGAGSRDNPIFVYGNKLDNILSSDTFSWLSGGAGDDTYYVASGIVLALEHDMTTNKDYGGIDTVYSLGDCELRQYVENLTLTGTANINGTGNALNNILVGNSGKNALAGMAGDDIYYVQNTNDIVSEKDINGDDTGGTDTVYS
ncbi:MAG: hypothetical protein JZU59_16850, partial [Chromatium okenii]|nr:hypothetical protein [Chromatium okenii]